MCEFVWRAVTQSLGALVTPSLVIRESSIELATGAHLLVEGWADARIGQSSKINILLILQKVKNATGLFALV